MNKRNKICSRKYIHSISTCHTKEVETTYYTYQLMKRGIELSHNIQHKGT